MQMHGERGMVVSFTVAMVLFGVIALWTNRAIPEPPSH
jgi:hypothetical protein